LSPVSEVLLHEINNVLVLLTLFSFRKGIVRNFRVSNKKKYFIEGIALPQPLLGGGVFRYDFAKNVPSEQNDTIL
jgi:hypothetical protein